MSRNMRNWMYVLFAVLIMCITLGYAYLNTTLNINGTTNITSANWSVYWDNVQFGSNNVTDITTPATIQTGLTEVLFNVNFSQPGDTYEFTVDAVNDGSINAMVSVVSNGVYASNGTTPKNLPDYLEYSVTYEDGLEIAQNHLLEAGDTATYKVRVHYKEDISSSQLPSTNDNYVFKFSVTYVQASDNAISLQRLYTANIFDNNWNEIYDGTNTSVVWIGQAIPNDITAYTSPADAMAAWNAIWNIDRSVFIKHVIIDNVVTDSYVGFVVTPEMAQANPGMTAGTYYLKGKKTFEYVNGSWQCISQNNGGNGSCLDPDYDVKKATLLSAFGVSNCTEDSYHIYCGVPYFTAYAYPNGDVSAADGASYCEARREGVSYCGISG